MNTELAVTIAIAVVSGFLSFVLAVIRQNQRHAAEESKKLADAVLIQNTNHNALVTRVAVLESQSNKA